MNQLWSANVNSADLILAVRGSRLFAGVPGYRASLHFNRRFSTVLTPGVRAVFVVWERHDQDRAACPVGPVMAYE